MTDRLSGTQWISEIDGVTVTVGFDDGAVFGTSGCNAYRSRYTADDERLVVPGPVMGTRMMCDPERMDVERRFLAALGAVRSATTTTATLTLCDASGAALLTLRRPSIADLVGTWWITSVHIPDRQAVVGTDDGLEVEIALDTISGDTGCNRFHGPYSVDGASMAIGPLATTRRAGSSVAMEQERAILVALGSVTAWRLGSDRVDLLRADGGIELVLTRRPTT
ncbi:MAG: META domain-containing protein [Ilumatobacteraceae bacterium]